MLHISLWIFCKNAPWICANPGKFLKVISVSEDEYLFMLHREFDNNHPSFQNKCKHYITVCGSASRNRTSAFVCYVAHASMHTCQRNAKLVDKKHEVTHELIHLLHLVNETCFDFVEQFKYWQYMSSSLQLILFNRHLMGEKNTFEGRKYGHIFRCIWSFMITQYWLLLGKDLLLNSLLTLNH